MKSLKAIFIISLLLIFGCAKENIKTSEPKHLTIVFVNDVHGQIENFAKLKHLVDAERAGKNVLLVSGGDVFSGNPVVDNHPEKGYPIIDIMNDCGFDVSVLGNHEFDYGPGVLQQRIEQSEFPWVCANVNVKNPGLQQPAAFYTVQAGDLRITFLGLLETAGSKNAVIPSTHPAKIADFEFVSAQNIIKSYIGLKHNENADLLIALSHLGLNSYENGIGDFQLAYENYFIDAIIGGHTHAVIDTGLSGIPIYQAGSYLNFVGKIELEIRDKKISAEHFDIIPLNDYPDLDQAIQNKINGYNDLPHLKEVIGFASVFHSRSQVGCFYTHALRKQMNVDAAFQNSGGVRSVLDYGDITVREIYEISPFNNGTLIYEMTIAQIREFLIGSQSGFYCSGIIPVKEGSQLIIYDESFRKIPDDFVLKVGINDYIPAVHSAYFPQNKQIQTLSAAETLIEYLRNNHEPVNFTNCSNYFKY